MERYDAAIIGAGPDGLIAAHRLASAGLKVAVFERRESAGGRAETREFHPGYRASSFADELPYFPSDLFWALNPPRFGALLMPAPVSTCVSAGGLSLIYREPGRTARAAGRAGPALAGFQSEVEGVCHSIAHRAWEVSARRGFTLPWQRPRRVRWPGEEWGEQSASERLAARISDPQLRLHLAANAFAGMATSPYHVGSALALLKGAPASGMPRGGLSALGLALERAARAAGAEIRLSCDVHDVHVEKGAAEAVILSDGEVVASRAVLSTLDLKRTFLSLVRWGALDSDSARQVARFRISGSRARVLIALDAPPVFDFAAVAPEAALGPIQIVDDLDSLARCHDSWRAGMVPDTLPVTLRVPSFADPSLAPPGKAVMTAMLGFVPSRLFDGEWTVAKRSRLVKIALDAAERVARGVSTHVVSVAVIGARDIEAGLGLTDGDLEGGEPAPDQALGFRPMAGWQDGRTPLRGLYLAGPSAAASPFILGGGGALAAEAILADIRTGWLK